MLTSVAGVLFYLTFDICECEPVVYTLKFADNPEKQINQENYERLNPEDHTWPAAKHLKEIKELNRFCYSFLRSRYESTSVTYESPNSFEDLLVIRKGELWNVQKPIPYTIIRCGSPGWAGYEIQLSPAFGSTCVFESTLKEKELVLHGVHCDFYNPGKVTSYYDTYSLIPNENSSPLNTFGYLSDQRISDLVDLNSADSIRAENLSTQNSSPPTTYGNLSDISNYYLKDLHGANQISTEYLSSQNSSPHNTSPLTTFGNLSDISNSDLRDLYEANLFFKEYLDSQNSSPRNSSTLTTYGNRAGISISDFKDSRRVDLISVENLSLQDSSSPTTSPPSTNGNLSHISISDLED